MSGAARRAGLVPWLIWGLASLFFTYAFFQRTNPSAMTGELMRDFDVSAAALGNLSAVYFYAYAAVQIPAGVAYDRWGPRHILGLAASACAGGTLIFALAPSIDIAVLGRVLIGAGAGFGYLGMLTLATIWFSPERYAVMVGLGMPFGIAGGVLGQAPFAAVLERVDWRTAMLGAAGFALALAVLFWASRRVRPPARSAKPAPAPHLFESLRAGARAPQTWILSLAGGLLMAPLFGFAGLWAVPWLTQVHGLSDTLAAGMASIMFVGLGIGAVASGWISNRLRRRKPILLLGAAAALAGWLVLLFAPGLSVVLQGLLFGAIGLSKGAAILTYVAARDRARGERAGAASAIINTFYLGGGALVQYFVGVALDARWDGRIEAGVRIYSPDAFDGALLIMPSCVALSLVVALALRESHPARRPRADLP